VAYYKDMNIAVVAANGRTGQAFVAAALAAGHHVRAGTHSHNPFSHNVNLTVLSCDATNDADIQRLIMGSDAVVSLIGHVKGSAPDVQTVATQQLVHTMQSSSVTRIVSLTGTGARLPGDQMTWIDRFLNLAIMVIDSDRIRDGQTHLTVLQKSNLEWTVIRVLKLEDRPVHPFSLKEHGPGKLVVGRTEAAQAILQVLKSHNFLYQAPVICLP
jgi:putative NADH-flavin reductase